MANEKTGGKTMANIDKNEIKDSQDFKDRIENSLRQAPNYLLIATTAAFQGSSANSRINYCKTHLSIV